MEDIFIIKTDHYQILEKIMAIERPCITFITWNYESIDGREAKKINHNDNVQCTY